MGNQSSHTSVFNQRSPKTSRKDIKSRFNFTGIKDITKCSYFSCLCSNNEQSKTMIDDLPSPDFEGNKLPFAYTYSPGLFQNEKAFVTLISSPRCKILRAEEAKGLKTLGISSYPCLSSMKELDLDHEMNINNLEAPLEDSQLLIETPAFKNQDSKFFNDN